MIGFFMLALPIMASLLSWAFEFERRHQLTERATSQAVSTASHAGLQLGNLLVKVNQTEVGNQAAHLVQDIFEGARDGVNDYTIKLRSTNENMLWRVRPLAEDGRAEDGRAGNALLSFQTLLSSKSQNSFTFKTYLPVTEAKLIPWCKSSNFYQ